ncbi:replication initiation protein RepC [Ruegeria sp.]|uniref:replication initiation protein RepC n=1 Tax=Ruegeria sp. TaxID=1879320 RepID=UPI003B00CB60
MRDFTCSGAPGVYDPARAHQIQAFIPGAEEHFVLPGDVTKATAINIAVAVLILMGGNATDALVYRKLADQTTRRAWHSGTEAPVNWRRQSDMARELGLSERQFRNIESRLERMGLIARVTAENGYRGRRAGQGYRDPVRCGLSLEPTLANYQAFCILLAEAGEEEAQRQERIWQIRTARHRLRRLIAPIEDAETRAWAQEAYADLKGLSPRGGLRGLEMGVLEHIHARLFDLEDRIRAALTPLTPEPKTEAKPEDRAEDQPESQPGPRPEPKTDHRTADHAEDQAGPRRDAPCPGDSERAPERAVENPAHQPAEDEEVRDQIPMENMVNQQDISAAPEIHGRCHIQPQSKPFESCNDLQSKMMTPAYAGDRVSLALHPDGRNDCFRNNDRKASLWINPEILQKLNQNTLKDLASEDAAMYLEVLEDWRDCLPYLLRDLSINISAWLEATDVMGDEIAFIALLVIDRNRFHPVTPVINPGGTLRACTRRAITGELNLTRAILGIWERDRQGKQPKAQPEGRALQ